MAARNIVVTGTSISASVWHGAYIGSDPFTAEDTFTNYGVGGSGIGGTSLTHSITYAATGGRKQQVINAYVPGVLNILIVEAGANDYYNNADTSGNLALLETLLLYCDDLRAVGYKVLLNTQLPQDGNTSIGLAHNASRLYIDPVVRAAVGSRIDACIDWANDPVLGPDSAAQGANTVDTDCFADYVHLTAEGAWRASLVARAAINSIESLSTQRFTLSAGITNDELVVAIL